MREVIPKITDTPILHVHEALGLQTGDLIWLARRSQIPKVLLFLIPVHSL